MTNNATGSFEQRAKRAAFRPSPNEKYQIAIRLDDYTFMALKKRAAKNDKTLSGMAREIIARFFI